MQCFGYNHVMRKSDYIVLLKRMLITFGLIVFSRVAFVIYNLNLVEQFEVAEISKALLHGVKFDLATTVIVNSIFIILSFFPNRSYIFKNFLKLVFVLSNLVNLAVLTVNIEFYNFIGKHITQDIFSMGTDISDQAFQIIGHYWYLFIVYALVACGLIRFYPRVKKDVNFEHKIHKWKSNIISTFVILSLIIVGRGGFQMRSLSPKDAFVFEQYELGVLALNPTYTLVRSLSQKTAKRVKYFKKDAEAISAIKKYRQFENGSMDHPGTNIVIIIMESLSTEYVGVGNEHQGYTPFFDELAKSGLYFSKNFANGRRSMEAMPSIMAGIPSLLGKPIYKSPYQSNQFFPMPKLLKENDYTTSFFHGGKRGTMGFDSYSKSIGIDKYFGLEDYPDQADYDGTWGIFDEPYFKYFVKEVSTFKEPFFTSVFSLSSHQPYSVPEIYQGKFPKGKIEIHESIGYADFSLKILFENAKKESWFKNTLFIITGDHTQKRETKTYDNILGKYRVPLLFYHPTIDLSLLDNSKVTQHADIFPSVMDFLGIEVKHKLLLGNSVFSAEEGLAINYFSHNNVLVKKDYYLHRVRKKFNLYRYDESMSHFIKSQNESQKEQMVEELKGYIQYFNNGLRKNRLYIAD